MKFIEAFGLLTCTIFALSLAAPSDDRWGTMGTNGTWGWTGIGVIGGGGTNGTLGTGTDGY